MTIGKLRTLALLDAAHHGRDEELCALVNTADPLDMLYALNDLLDYAESTTVGLLSQMDSGTDWDTFIARLRALLLP